MYAKTALRFASLAFTLAGGFVATERAAHAEILQDPAGPNTIAAHWSIDKTGSELFFQVRVNRVGYQATQLEFSLPQYTLRGALPLTDYVMQGDTCSEGLLRASCTFPWNTGTFRVRSSDWSVMPGTALDIGVGRDPMTDTWAIGATPSGASHQILHWTMYGWETVAGDADHIDVGPNGPWAVASDNTIWTLAAGAWRNIPGLAKQVAVGADGSVWALGNDWDGTGYGVFKWTGGTLGMPWVRQPYAAATRIDVGPDGNPWAVANDGTIWHFEGGRFVPKPGAAVDIACGADGSVFALGTGFVGDGNEIFKWNGAGWDRLPGGATRISADGRGNAMAIANDQRIFVQTL